jgi:Reverse transcriptase (RNA-dependent DNA polymerase)
MRAFFRQAIDNVISHGDTDVFPHPFENLIFYDRRDDVLGLLESIHRDADFEERIAASPPSNESMLAPIGYTGFRWATQLDPLWNLYLLGLVLSVADVIEAARIGVERHVIFSYRYSYDDTSHDVFRRDVGWTQFMQHSLSLSRQSRYVVVCDISDFYQRLGHHRLENALGQLPDLADTRFRIMKILSHFSGNRSYGLPVGGPAARLLSELVLNQVDRLLLLNRVCFCRFADDYHIFTDSMEHAYDVLVFLSEKLLHNEGLTLQKSKTRIMTSREFQLSSPVEWIQDETDELEAPPPRSVASVETDARAFLRLSLRFDPYSPTAMEDYETLKREVGRFDILGMIQRELAKSRVHAAVARKLLSAIRFLEPPQRRDAVLSLVENLELLYPIFSSVMIVIKNLFDELELEVRERIVNDIQKLMRTDSYLVKVDIHLCFALRVLAGTQTPESEEIVVNLYGSRRASLIRRDVVLIMAKWNQWPWISDLRNSFRNLSPAERRAFIVASFILGDEGRHWRQHIKRELSEFENITKEWAAERKKKGNLRIPI